MNHFSIGNIIIWGIIYFKILSAEGENNQLVKKIILIIKVSELRDHIIKTKFAALEEISDKIESKFDGAKLIWGDESKNIPNFELRLRINCKTEDLDPIWQMIKLELQALRKSLFTTKSSINAETRTPDKNLKIQEKIEPFMQILNEQQDRGLKVGMKLGLELLAQDLVQKEAELKQEAVEKKELQLKYSMEKRDRIKEEQAKLTMMAWLDLGEEVQEFVNDCYPSWAKKRDKKNDFSDPVWQKIFLNIENPKVVKLKALLAKYEIPESKYVSFINKLLVRRNNEALPELSFKQKQQAYYNFTEQFYEDRKMMVKIALNIATMNFVDNDEGKHDVNNDRTIEESIISSTKEKRAPFKLVRMSKFQPPFRKETDLQRVFEKLIERNKHLEKPVAYYLDKTGAYVLFRNYDHAIQYFSKRDEMRGISIFERESMIIVDVYRDAPYEGRCKLKIKLSHGSTIEDFQNQLKTYQELSDLFKEDQMPANAKQGFHLFIANDFEQLLQAYQICKDNFLKSSLSEVSIFTFGPPPPS